MTTKTKTLALLAVLLPGLLLAAPSDAANKDQATAPAINLWVDLGLGLISEEDAAETMKSLDADFESALKSETEALTSNLYGVRHVSGEQFAALVAEMDVVSSFSTTTVIGATKELGYLEVRFSLNGRHGYVAIVCAPLNDVPEATREKVIAPGTRR
jgi:hypothetical protein